MRFAFAFLLALLWLPASAAATNTAPISGGVFQQGGYIYGKTPPGAEVKLLNTAVKTDKDGYFFAGLHRHFPTKGMLEVKLPDGEVQMHPFKVSKREYPVQHIKGVKRKHVTPDPMQVKRSRAEAAAIRASREPFSQLKAAFGGFELPLADVPKTGVYGSSRTYNGQERSWHKGMDLAAPTGTPVYAPADGKVTAAIEDTFFNGNIMTIDHGYGLFTIYAHLNTMALEKGDKIKQGDKIGTVGATGRATGPHLHWGAYWHNVALDPEIFLRNNEENK